MSDDDARLVHFVEDYTFTPDEDRRTAVKYKAGYRGIVRKQCSDKAIALGRAVEVRAPRRRKGAT